MTVVAIDHVQLAMPPGRETDAVAFYEGLLGITHVPKPPHLAVRGGCWFEDAPLKVHLGVEQDFRAARKAHPALRVNGLYDLLATLRAAGVEIVDDEPLEGYDRAYVNDPFGNRIELLEPLDAGEIERRRIGQATVDAYTAWPQTAEPASNPEALAESSINNPTSRPTNPGDNPHQLCPRATGGVPSAAVSPGDRARGQSLRSPLAREGATKSCRRARTAERQRVE